MTDRYVGPGGSDTNDGLSWATRKLTLNGVEDTPVVAGDTVYVGPGVYRETLTVDISGSSGNIITYIGDVSGINTDGIGGVCRITGSDDDETESARTTGISAAGSNDDFRTFRGFSFDTFANGDGIRLSNPHTDWLVEDCFFNIEGSQGQGVELFNAIALTNITVRRCVFMGTSTGTGRGVHWTGNTVLNDQNGLVENCLFIGGDRAVDSTRIGGITVKNCTFIGCGRGVSIAAALDTGQTVTVNNCNFTSCFSAALIGTVTGEIVEDYNNFEVNGVDRTNTDTGSNSQAYVSFFDFPTLFAGYDFSNAFSFVFGLAPHSPLAGIAGSSEATDDLFGTTRPATSSKKSWGAFQSVDVEREEIITYGSSAAALGMRDAARVPFKVAVTPIGTTFSVRVYREADYAGTLPQMIIKQPGVADDVTVDTGSAEEWNLLTTTLVPSSNTDYVFIELVSNNTATSGEYDVIFDNLSVT